MHRGNDTAKILAFIGSTCSDAMKKNIETSDQVIVIPAKMGLFPSGEPFVEPFYKGEADWEKNQALLHGKKAVIMQSVDIPVSDNALYLLMMAHTLKSYGVSSVTAAVPFAPFMRQDRKFNQRFVSLGALFYAEQLKSAGVDNVITVTPHSQDSILAYQKVFGEDHFKALTTTELFAQDIRKNFASVLDRVMVGAPDGAEKPNDEGQRRARELAHALFSANLPDAEIDRKLFKIRKIHTDVSITEIQEFTGDVVGKICIVVDDMIDGGSTMINAAKHLKSLGADTVLCYAAHPILSGHAIGKIFSATLESNHLAVDRLVLTDTLPGVEKKLASLAEAFPAWKNRANILTVADMVLEAALTMAKQPERHLNDEADITHAKPRLIG